MSIPKGYVWPWQEKVYGGVVRFSRKTAEINYWMIHNEIDREINNRENQIEQLEKEIKEMDSIEFPLNHSLIKRRVDHMKKRKKYEKEMKKIGEKPEYYEEPFPVKTKYGDERYTFMVRIYPKDIRLICPIDTCNEILNSIKIRREIISKLHEEIGILNNDRELAKKIKDGC